MPSSPKRLTTRVLNRTLLERQSLLRRRRRDPLAEIERLVGLQAQVPRDPYLALWSRLERVSAAAISDALGRRDAVRMTLFRGTLHLVTSRDAVSLRPLVQPVVERMTQSQRAFREASDGIDVDDLRSTLRSLLEEEPRTRADLVAAIADRYPGRDVAALGVAMYHLPTVQVTPRGLWRRSGASAFAMLDRWLDGATAPPATLEDLALRYLAVFGPATPADAQTWSGIPGWRGVFETLRPRLRVRLDEGGRELFDHPDARLAYAELEAPVRFLPEYDNALLAHGDRSRVIPSTITQWTGVGWGPVLVDGFVAARWRLFETRTSASLRIEPFRRLSREERADVLGAAEAVARFLRDGAEDTAFDVHAFGR
jgi:hypothetical protein